MYKRMLVLLDGSKMAEVVFSYARELSGRLNLDLDLLHVCNVEESQQFSMRQAYIEHMAETLRSQCEEIKSKAGLKDGRKAAVFRGKVVVGYPAEEILKYAEQNSIDIIMLSTHGKSGIKRWGLGSVADKVIHQTSASVWVVPAALHEGILYDKMPEERAILVPLDGSELAEAVIPHIITLVKQRDVDTSVTLVNVARLPSHKFTDEEREFIGENPAAIPTAGRLYLEKIAAQFREEGLKVEFEQLVGDPAEEIVRYAAATHPRLIVMSTHGRSGFSRFVFGSVTENVLHRLQKTPLFLVSPPL
jgi:nucleotide-binding universal stress UspA family protein